MLGGKRPTTREERAQGREELLAALDRELARHNLRISYTMDTDILTPEDRELLSGDTPADEVRDRENIRRWSVARTGTRHGRAGYPRRDGAREALPAKTLSQEVGRASGHPTEPFTHHGPPRGPYVVPPDPQPRERCSELRSAKVTGDPVRKLFTLPASGSFLRQPWLQPRVAPFMAAFAPTCCFWLQGEYDYVVACKVVLIGYATVGGQESIKLRARCGEKLSVLL